MKDKIELTQKQYDSYAFRKPLGEGARGRIYPYNKCEVIKLWNKSILLKTLEEYRRNVVELQQYHYHSLILPKKIVYVDGEVEGYIMRYFSGVNISEIKDESSMKYFMTALRRLENAILDISSNHILLDDTHDENIMYYQKMNKGIVTCVDSDSWVCDKSKPIDRCFKHNMSSVNYTIINSLIRSEKNTNYQLIDFIYSNGDLRNRFESIDCNASTELFSFLRDVLLYLKEYTNKNIETVGDFKRVLK